MLFFPLAFCFGLFFLCCQPRVSTWPTASHHGCGSDGRGPALPGPVSSLMPLPCEGLTTDTHKHGKPTSVICQLNRGFQRNCPARKFVRVICSLTTPFSLSESWLFASALMYFSPSTVFAFSVLGPVRAVSDACKSEAHTVPCLHTPHRPLYNRLHSVLHLPPGEKGEKLTRTCA